MGGSRMFHVDDVVAFKNGEKMDAVGYVDRTYGDVDSHEPLPGNTYGMKIHHSKALPRTAYKQFMKDGVPPKGFVLVQWQTHPKTELVAEKELELLDRTFLAGDHVRRDYETKESTVGTVVSVRRKCTLLGMCEAMELKSGKVMRAAWLPSPLDDQAPLLELAQVGQVLSDIPASELQFVHQYNEGDLVVYKNWLGRIRECFDEITVRLSDNSVVTLKNELDLEAMNGDPNERLSVGSIVKTKKGCLRTGLWRYGAYSPNITPVGVVVDARTQEFQVDWLQHKLEEGNAEGSLHPSNNIPEFVITQDELESGQVFQYDITRRPNNNDSIPTKVMSDLDIQGGLRVRFKDATGASVKYDGSTPHGKFERIDRRQTLGYDMNVFTVTNTLTEVDVQWNDLTMSTELATALIPDFAIDDEDAVFPGDIVCSNEYKANGPDGTIQPDRVGVVQEVNSADRVARVRWCQGGQLSFLETTFTTPVPGSWKGNPEGESEEISYYEITRPELINRQRGDYVLLSDSMYQALGMDFEPGSIHWLGEVVDVKPDGFCIVRLGASQPIKEIGLPTETTFLALKGSELDGMHTHDHSEMEDDDYDEDDAMSFMSDSEGLIDFSDDEDFDMDDEGQWFVAGQPGVPVDDEDDSWSTASEDDNGDDTDSLMMDAEDPPNSSIPEDINAPPRASDASIPQPRADAKHETTLTTIEEMNLASFSGAPLAYDIVDSDVPANHPFAHRIAANSSGHMKAVQKEHKILRGSSSLPSGIYVRTWESRLDLIRVLFIGPIGTPYEYAPFVVDLFLGPDFPSGPPVAHFHSWTSEGAGMQGRVNPNLYEDGKICLSLLGTWQGDDAKGEGWTLGKSTVLQLLVSILGLVLVKEPYYNEAGYEPLQGLSSSRLSSSVYTERTYLRARAFLIASLGSLLQPRRDGDSPSLSVPQGAEGFESVLKWLYITPTGPNLLQKAIEAGKTILANSETTGDKDGLTAVSRGAGLLLKRVVSNFERMKKESDAQS